MVLFLSVAISHGSARCDMSGQDLTDEAREDHAPLFVTHDGKRGSGKSDDRFQLELILALVGQL